MSYKDFPCMDDSPLNNGKYYRDEDEMDKYYGTEFELDDELYPNSYRTENKVVVSNNFNQFNCTNDLGDEK